MKTRNDFFTQEDSWSSVYDFDNFLQLHSSPDASTLAKSEINDELRCC